MPNPASSFLRWIKNEIFNVDRPVKHLMREIRKHALIDQKEILSHVDVKTIFDVGANIGQSTAGYRAAFPKAMVYSFEPTSKPYAELSQRFANDPRVKSFQLGMSSNPGAADIFLSEATVSSSLFPPSEGRPGFAPGLPRETINLTSVEYFCREHNLDYINIFKVDVQGAELMVFDGMRSFLEECRIDILFCEVNFGSFYKGQTDYHELFSYLSRYDYLLFDLYNIVYGYKGSIRWGDALFISHKIANVVLDK